MRELLDLDPGELLGLPLARGQRGKIRLQIGGTSTDLVAETDSDAALAPGEIALVVGMRGNVALVSPTARDPAPQGRGNVTLVSPVACRLSPAARHGSLPTTSFQCTGSVAPSVDQTSTRVASVMPRWSRTGANAP